MLMIMMMMIIIINNMIMIINSLIMIITIISLGLALLAPILYAASTTGALQAFTFH